MMHYPPLPADPSGFLNPQTPGLVGAAAVRIAATGIDARRFFTSGNHDRNEITSHFGAAKDWLPIQEQIGDGAGYHARAIN